MAEEVDDAQEADETEFDPARARAALDKARREAQNLRTRLKEVEPLATKAREADEAAKTEAQKHAEARAQAERERDEARTELLRLRVAAAKGLDASLAARLHGTTEEELNKDADELLKLLPPKTAAPPGGRPVADLKPGALPGSSASTAPTTSAQIDAWIRGRAHRNQ